jgi:hypothetical protein
MPSHVSDVRWSGPVACALTELVIDQLIRAEITAPILDRGAVGITDNFGFKPTLKNICVAREMPGDATSAAALDQFETVLRTAYSLPFMQPHIGFLLDVDPQLAYQWRMRQDGRVGVNEDLWLAGRRGEESFMALQNVMAAKLREAAVEWGWHVLEIDGRPQSETAAEAIETIMRAPGVQRLTDREVATT